MSAAMTSALEVAANREDFVASNSGAMQALNVIIANVARTDIPILLVGESGTGKEVYARFIHSLAGFDEASLTKISCTTAEASKLVVTIRAALQPSSRSNGTRTLFLDSIDELDLACQRALLPLLPDGDPKGISGKAAVRLISSTTKDLEKEIAAGHFRRELYFRLSGVCLRLPALRERKEDISALLAYFLARHSKEFERKPPLIDERAMEIFTSYHWPGNIRELGNLARKIAALNNVEGVLSDLRSAEQMQSPAKNVPFSSLKLASRAASRRAERELILKALEHTRWNRKRAAQQLQISYKSLLYKIKQIGAQNSDSD
jgi:two-component system response regulator AtoC